MICPLERNRNSHSAAADDNHNHDGHVHTARFVRSGVRACACASNSYYYDYFFYSAERITYSREKRHAWGSPRNKDRVGPHPVTPAPMRPQEALVGMAHTA